MLKHNLFRKTGLAGIIGLMTFTLSYGQFDWTVRYSIPNLYSLTSVAWTGSQFVAVGNIDTVFTSPDGVTWTTHYIAEARSLYSVIWKDSLLMAVGDSGRILTSPDGITWTRQTSPTTNTLYSVIWADIQYVAVGAGAILTSPDGVSWTQTVLGTDIFRSVTWTDSLLVAVGENGIIRSSPDGITWTNHTSGTTLDFYSVYRRGGLYVVAGEYCIYTSSDCVTWTRRLSPTIRAYSIVWTGSRYIIVGGSGYWRYFSSDGITWSGIHVESESEGIDFYSMVWTGSQIVSVGSSGSVVTSSNGTTWVIRRQMIQPGAFRSVTWNGSQFAAYGDSAAASTDGVTWTLRSTGIDTSYNYLLFASWAGDCYLAATTKPSTGVYDYGCLHRSTEGITWPTRKGWTDWYMRSAIKADSQYVVVGYYYQVGKDSAVIITSPDGTNWTERCSGTEGSTFGTLLYSVAWTGSLIAAVGVAYVNQYLTDNHSTVLTSPDGEIWTQCLLPTSRALYSITWADSQLVTVGDSGKIFTSPDGVTWTSRVSGVTIDLNSVIWSGGQLVAVGEAGTILTSPDGVTWTPQISGTTKTLYSVTCSDNLIVAAGDMYTIVTSPNVTNLPLPPATPTLASPANAATALPVQLTLVWNLVSSAASYDVQVSNDSGFTSITMVDSALTTTRRGVNGLAYITTYYWRVRAKNVYGVSAWSGYRSFTTAMPPPTLVSPVDAASDQLVSLTLVWNRVSSAATYHVQVATDTGFTAIFLRDSTHSDSQRVVSGLSNGTVYYWRVRAKNAGGVSAWSGYRSFFTLGALPSAVLTLAPAYSEVIDIDSVRLVWKIAAPAVDRYLVEVATDSAMTSLVVQDSSVTDTTRLLTALVNNTTYYWRVKAHNTAGWGSYSAETRFVTSFVGVLFNGNAIRALSMKYSSGMLRYTIPNRCYVSVKYYDIRGRMVGSFVNSTEGAGAHSLSLPLSSWAMGAYIQVFTAGEIVRKDRIMVVK
jgi:hypothetical protein